MSAHAPVICNNCGFDIAQQIDQKYCAKCGTKVGVENSHKSQRSLDEYGPPRLKVDRHKKPDFSVPPNETFLYGHLVWLVFIAYITSRQLAALTGPAAATVVGAVTVALILWFIFGFASKTRLEKRGTVLEIRKRQLDLGRLVAARIRGANTVELRDDYGNILGIYLVSYQSRPLALLLKAIEPYILADDVERDDKVIRKLDAFIKRYNV